tara:strand:+ start:2673 stop:3428 length:756 start_codon:yes stop_codon:yes gene_type:complete
MKLRDKISNWLNDYLVDNNLDTFVIGISGGIDSAVTSTLCARTGRKTYVVVMPIHQNPEETQRGDDHCHWLKETYPNVEQINVELSSIYDKFLVEIPSKFHSGLTLANTRARIRMSTLYMIAGSSNGIVAGTGNKVEDFGVGFFTKYGDGGVDISPIADLMKSEVYKLGRELGVIDSILNAAPTDGLWDDDRTDEDQLGVSYDELEWAMNYDGSDIDERQQHILDVYNKHRKQNLHKMKEIPIFKKKDQRL